MTVRVRNVGPTSFQFRLEEWDYQDGPHGTETVSYLVVEAGAYAVPGGGTLVAGHSTGIDYENVRTEALPVGGFAATPLVLRAGGHRERRARGRAARHERVDGLLPAAHRGRGRARAATSPIEDVHWIALEPAAIPGVLQAALLPTVDENPDQVSYSQGFPAPPHLLASDPDAQRQRHDRPAPLRGHDERRPLARPGRAVGRRRDGSRQRDRRLAGDPPQRPDARAAPALQPPAGRRGAARPGRRGRRRRVAPGAGRRSRRRRDRVLGERASGRPRDRPGHGRDHRHARVAGHPSSSRSARPTRATRSGEAEFVWTVRARLEALPFPAPPTLVGGDRLVHRADEPRRQLRVPVGLRRRIGLRPVQLARGQPYVRGARPLRRDADRHRSGPRLAGPAPVRPERDRRRRRRCGRPRAARSSTRRRATASGSSIPTTTRCASSTRSPRPVSR